MLLPTWHQGINYEHWNSKERNPRTLCYCPRGIKETTKNTWSAKNKALYFPAVSLLVTLSLFALTTNLLSTGAHTHLCSCQTIKKSTVVKKEWAFCRNWAQILTHTIIPDAQIRKHAHTYLTHTHTYLTRTHRSMAEKRFVQTPSAYDQQTAVTMTWRPPTSTRTTNTHIWGKCLCCIVFKCVYERGSLSLKRYRLLGEAGF